MPDTNAYEASQVDWVRIRAYAKRVAREAHKPLDTPLGYYVTAVEEVEESVQPGAIARLFGAKPVARLVMKEEKRFVKLIGPHWKIRVQDWHREEVTPHRSGGGRTEESTHERISYILCPDGSLKYVTTWTEGVLRVGGGVHYREKEDGLIRDFTDQDVRDFDFDNPHYEKKSNKGRITVWGNRGSGSKLLRHAKGVGLTLALKSLHNYRD